MMTPDQFSVFLRDPKWKPMLDAMIADNRRIDAQIAGVPETRPCPFCDEPQYFAQAGVATILYRCANDHASAVSR